MVITSKDFDDFRKSMEGQIEKSVQKATASSMITMKAAVSDAVKLAVTPLHAEIAELRTLLEEARNKITS